MGNELESKSWSDGVPKLDLQLCFVVSNPGAHGGLLEQVLVSLDEYRVMTQNCGRASARPPLSDRCILGRRDFHIRSPSKEDRLKRLS
jgi:hypothetical protein